MSDGAGQLDTPVAVFVYNRPEPTKRVLNCVRSVDPARLLVVADGAVPGDDND
jgi:hypothetical protein